MKLETKVRFQITWARIRKWSWLLFLILLFFIIIEFNAYITSPLLISISNNSFLTALIGAIVGGVLAFWGSVYVQQNQVKATSAIQRRDIIFIPVYNELLKLKKSLFEYPCPSSIDFSGKSSYPNNPDFTVWPAFKEDSRHLQMPKSLSDSLDHFMSTCQQYSDKWQIASKDKKVDEVIKGIIIANSVQDNSHRTDLVYHYLPCNHNFSGIKEILISDTSRQEQKGQNSWQLIPTKSDKELEEITNRIYAECSKIESVKQLQKVRDSIDSDLEELIKSLELAIRFINEKVEGNERWV